MSEDRWTVLKDAFTHNQFWWVVSGVILLLVIFLGLVLFYRPVVFLEVVQTKAEVTPVVDKVLDIVGRCVDAETLACQEFWGRIISH